MTRHWSAVIPCRNESVRLISVRCSRKKEVELYESERFRKKFDHNQEDIVDDLELATLHKPNQEQRRINVDFPA